MDRQRSSIGAGLLLLPLLLFTQTHAWSLPVSPPNSDASWSPVVAATVPAARQLNGISPYLDLALCPIRVEPWGCARQKSARILDVWDDELNLQWQKLKVEADRQMNATIERRGYSASELPIKEKPSTLLKKIEIGTKYMKEYLAETMDGFLGREYEYLQTSKAANDSENGDDDDDVDDDETDADADADAEEADEESDVDDDEDENDASNSLDQETTDDEEDEAEEDDNEPEPENDNESVQNVAAANDVKTSVFSDDGTSSAVEFIELQDGEETAAGAVKKPASSGGGKRKKDKKRKQKKKKGQQQQQPATLVVVQAAPEHHDVDTGGHGGGGHGGGGDHGGGSGGHGVGKPHRRKTKRSKRKKKHQQSAVQVEHETTDTLGLGLDLLDDLVDVAEVGGKRKHIFPINYGRSNGVTRGKKKKKKKALAKLALIGSLLKAKIELLLKILGAHLQIKFFAIALIGLLINIARFWIDVKRGGTPAKVVYVEHAHHQHHYEDHGEDWGGEQGGSYWKRSLQTDPSIEDVDSSTDSYQNRPQQQQSQDPQYLAYRNHYQWQ